MTKNQARESAESAARRSNLTYCIYQVDNGQWLWATVEWFDQNRSLLTAREHASREVINRSDLED